MNIKYLIKSISINRLTIRATISNRSQASNKSKIRNKNQNDKIVTIGTIIQVKITFLLEISSLLHILPAIHRTRKPTRKYNNGKYILVHIGILILIGCLP